MTHAWVIRSGSHGERDAWALQSGCSGGGWGEVEDLTECSTRDDVAHATAKAYAGAADGKLANFTGQLWALRGRIKPGDLMVMPIGALVAEPAEQAALGRMSALAVQGASTRQIARVLAAEVYPTKRGGRWTSPVVARILARSGREGAAA